MNKKLRFTGMETAILSDEIRNHRGMTREPLSDAAHAGFATLNFTDRSRIPDYLAAEQARCEVQYSRALRRLMQSQATRAKTFQAVEPGVPEPESVNSLEIQDPPEAQAENALRNEPESNPAEPDTNPG